MNTEKDPPQIADIGNQTLYTLGESTIEVDFVKVDEVQKDFPFARVDKSTDLIRRTKERVEFAGRRRTFNDFIFRIFKIDNGFNGLVVSRKIAAEVDNENQKKRR